MDKRGIGVIGAIAAMVVAGLIIYGLIFYGPALWGSIQRAIQGTPGGLPLYPDAEPYTPDATVSEFFNWTMNNQMPANWSWRIYKSSAYIEDIADWYRSQMVGWTKESDYSTYIYPDSGIALSFSKNNEGAVVVLYHSFTPRILLLHGPKEGITYALNVRPPAGV